MPLSSSGSSSSSSSCRGEICERRACLFLTTGALFLASRCAITPRSLSGATSAWKRDDVPVATTAVAVAFLEEDAGDEVETDAGAFNGAE